MLCQGFLEAGLISGAVSNQAICVPLVSSFHRDIVNYTTLFDGRGMLFFMFYFDMLWYLEISFVCKLDVHCTGCFVLGVLLFLLELLFDPSKYLMMGVYICNNCFWLF